MFSTNVGGRMSDLRRLVISSGAKLIAYYGSNGDDALRNPFGGDWIVSMQVNNHERAEEDVWAIQLKYNFERLGAKGLSATFQD